MSAVKNRYRNRYSRFVRKHTLFLLLDISGLMLYCLAVIDPAVTAILHGSRTYGGQMLLLLVFPLVFFALWAVAAVWALWYLRGILSLLRGSVLVKTGRVTQKRKRTYEVTTVLPKHMKRSSYQHLTRPERFYIRDRDCERVFQAGDMIRVVYPASRVLRTGPQGIPAIYAFSGDDAGEWRNVSAEALSGKELRKRLAVFGILLTLATAGLFCLLAFLWNIVWVNSWGQGRPLGITSFFNLLKSRAGFQV